MEAQVRYHRWLERLAEQDLELHQELAGLDDAEILDRFHREIEFGTAGLRGLIGAGTNRVNRYMIRKATAGLAAYIKGMGDASVQRGVVIAYDSRRMSQEFAEEAAMVLAYHGIKTYLFTSLRATPVLSFAVRQLGTIAGIVITASHNPAPYNGYKVYGEDGGQMAPEIANKILAEMDQIEDEINIPVLSFTQAVLQGLIEMIDETIDEPYLQAVTALAGQPDFLRERGAELSIVYTPLHGTGRHPVVTGLERIGMRNVFVVPEQADPDPAFSTVKAPNPEELSVYELAIRYGDERNADLLLATDPDADRVGIVIKNDEGRYVTLTGNQIAALLLDYLLLQKQAQNTLPENGVIVKSIVSSELGTSIAARYGIQTVNVLTGFKFIAEKIEEYERTGEHTFLFGYEESYGYLVGSFVRDKDAVQTALLLSEATLHWKSQGKSLYQRLQELFTEYGHFQEQLLSYTFAGVEGMERIQRIMEHFRTSAAVQEHAELVLAEDYLTRTARQQNGETQPLELPVANVLKLRFQDGSWVAVRPSGTEPKLKIYVAVQGESKAAAQQRLEQLVRFAKEQVE